jgi:hypothetical protein
MKLAELVVIRGKPDYRFDVDGEDFPWWVSEKGVEVTQLTDDLFAVKFEILCISKVYDSDEHRFDNCRVGEGDLPVRLEGYAGRRLFIGDVEFPWDITGDGVKVECSRRIFLTVTLAFFAKDVDSNQYIEDARNIMNINGDHWAFSPDTSKSHKWGSGVRLQQEVDHG